jgi:hypothetical protein
MAKFLPGPTVASVSGSIGGTVFSRNRYGMYMRNRTKPVVSTTSYATAAKARLAAGSTAWQGLTNAQRDAWRHWANNNPVIGSLGMQQVLTGHAAYVGNYCRALILSETPLDVPPITAAPAPLTSLVLDADLGLGDVDLTYTATPTGAAEKLWIDAAVSDSAGIRWVENLYRFVGLSGVAEASPFVILSIVEARLGTLINDQTLHVRVRVVENVGMMLSAPLSDSAVVETTV